MSNFFYHFVSVALRERRGEFSFHSFPPPGDASLIPFTLLRSRLRRSVSLVPPAYYAHIGEYFSSTSRSQTLTDPSGWPPKNEAANKVRTIISHDADSTTGDYDPLRVKHMVSPLPIKSLPDDLFAALTVSVFQLERGGRLAPVSLHSVVLLLFPFADASASRFHQMWYM